MTYLIILGVYLLVLFVFAWSSRRAMGVPTLALAAGALMAELWTKSLTPLVAQTGLVIVQPPLSSVVAVTLTLFPALIVMIRAPKVASRFHAITGSILFAVLGVMLTYGAFSNAVVLDEASKGYVLEMVKYQNIIITACVGLALVGVLVGRPHHSRRDDKKR